jgi:hypothetical protein
MTTTTTPQSSAAVDTAGPGRTVSIVGIVLGALALLLGVFTGIPGLICGIVGVAKGNRLGWVAVAVSVLAMIVAIAVGFAVVGGHHH